MGGRGSEFKCQGVSHGLASAVGTFSQASNQVVPAVLYIRESSLQTRTPQVSAACFALNKTAATRN